MSKSPTELTAGPWPEHWVDVSDDPVKRLLDALAPVLDREVCQPFISAWEFDEVVDAEKAHAAVVEAARALKAWRSRPT